jgi:hypothetical protein
VKLQLLALVAAAGIAGCATDYVPPPTVARPGPADEYYTQDGRPGIAGDLRWRVDPTGKKEPVRVSEEADFKRWKESAPSDAERREFEEWRAWQEWKRNNPK